MPICFSPVKYYRERQKQIFGSYTHLFSCVFPAIKQYYFDHKNMPNPKMRGKEVTWPRVGSCMFQKT